MNSSEQNARPQDAPYTHFIKPRHSFTFGEQRPESRAEAIIKTPREE